MAVRMNYGSEEFRSSEEAHFVGLKLITALDVQFACVSTACLSQNQRLAYTYLFIMPQNYVVVFD